MRFMKSWMRMVPATCAMVILMAAGSMGKDMKADMTKSAEQDRKMVPQTTCPASGQPIDKRYFVDYNGQRIYVCNAGHMDQVKKDPEKYIKKLERMGQSVELISQDANTEAKWGSADTSMKGKKMTGDASMKPMEAGYWTCTMHPQVHNSKPGNCPICGMKLVHMKGGKDTTKMMGGKQGMMKK